MDILRQKAGQPPAEFARHVSHVAQKRRASLYPDTGVVGSIIQDVRVHGDGAIYRYEKKFGGLDSRRIPMRLSKDEIARAYDEAPAEQLEALKMAAGRLAKTEKSTLRMLKTISTTHGRRSSNSNDNDNDASTGPTRVTRKFVPLRSVGCYIPGGLARYPSSAVMCITPAAIAKVPRIAAVTPAAPDGTTDPLTIAAADLCGATEIYRMGGAHAIAALAYGTNTLPRVDKIVGPGGAYVTAAKHAVSADVGIDMLAGPTELGIIADSAASARLVALDLISQAEHSADTQCCLVTTSSRLVAGVNRVLSGMLGSGSLNNKGGNTKHNDDYITNRSSIVTSSIAKNGFIALARDKRSVVEVANALAPEHLEIMTRHPAPTAERIITPGMILLGGQSPSAASDYLLGSNHVLPTNGSGRARGSLSVLDFVKMMTITESTGADLLGIQKALKHMTEAEGLANHYLAVSGRLKGTM